MTHQYKPDPTTGRCLDCMPIPPGGRRCLWCGHQNDQHTGDVDPVVLKHYEIEVPGPIGGKPVKSSRVRWTPTACSTPHCACRRYEVSR
jgi:hypothetical protein